MSNSQKKKSEKPEQRARAFAATQPAEYQAYAESCYLRGFKDGHRQHIEEAASLEAVEEEALSAIPEGEWRDLIKEWLTYKRSVKKRYTLVSSIVGCYQDLLQESHGDIALAEQWVRRSINNGYIGIAIPHGPTPYTTRIEGRKEQVRGLSRLASEGAEAIAAYYSQDEQ